MKLLNLTPHTVNIQPEPGDEIFRVPQGGRPARVEYLDADAVPIEHEGAFFPTFVRRVKGLKNLPPMRPGILIIVSRQVAEVAHDRLDLVVPDIQFNDARGRVAGCRRLAHLSWNTSPGGLAVKTQQSLVMAGVPAGRARA